MLHIMAINLVEKERFLETFNPQLPLKYFMYSHWAARFERNISKMPFIRS